MKIHISTLLLTVLIFQHFGELNAAEPKEASPTIASLKKQRSRKKTSRHVPGPAENRPPGRRVNQDKYRVADPDDGPPHRLIRYRDIEISVWLDSLLRVRKAIFPENYIPQRRYFKNYNFLIRIFEQEDVELVAYFNQPDRLIGVRPRDPTGALYNLEPTESVWYINYAATHLRITVKNSAPIGISLMPKNVHVPERHSFELQTVAAITFKVFTEEKSKKITGAELVC